MLKRKTRFKLGTITRVTSMRDDVKGQGHQAAVGGCTSHHLQDVGGGMWRSHYRRHNLFSDGLVESCF